MAGAAWGRGECRVKQDAMCYCCWGDVNKRSLIPQRELKKRTDRKKEGKGRTWLLVGMVEENRYCGQKESTARGGHT